jgi:MEDS: MEthanogen/methylotroph, DcmR Sensory domain
MLDKIKQSNFGEHNLILFEDYFTLNNILLEYCKTALESLNEMVILLPHNESVSNLFHGLKNIDLDVQKYKLQGSLVIVEAKKGYFSLTNELVDIMIMIKMLLQRSNKLGKSGLTVFSDMGLFFNYNRIDDLIKHEAGLFLSLSSSIYSNKMKIFCYYNITDFERLTENQKQGLLNNHSRTWQNPDRRNQEGK